MLQKSAEFEGHIAQIMAKPGITDSLYAEGRTVHNLRESGIDDQDDIEHVTSSSSKVRLRLHRVYLPRWTALIIEYEVSKLDPKLFEMDAAVFKDWRCSSGNDSCQSFGGMCMEVASDYLQLLQLDSTRLWVEDEDDANRSVNVHLFRELSRASRI